MDVYIEKMGPLGLPLLLCSIASLAVILERTAVLLSTRLPRRRIVKDFLDEAKFGHGDALTALARHIPAPLGAGFLLLLDNADHSRAIREEHANVWLDDLQRQLNRNIRFLHLIAVISPLLGLLGTVIGMILAFQDISAYHRPINPSVVADGLWQALLTTAFGLLVALPALFCAHLFQMRVARLVGAIRSDLNRLNLIIETGETAPSGEHHGSAP